jgi:hypothetical protein
MSLSCQSVKINYPDSRDLFTGLLKEPIISILSATGELTSNSIVTSYFTKGQGECILLKSSFTYVQKKLYNPDFITNNIYIYLDFVTYK